MLNWEIIFESYFSFKFILIAVLCFLGSFVDAISGGGGLITLPAISLIGVDPIIALGTNKLVNTASSIGSTINYTKSGKVNWKLMIYLMPLSFIGSYLGVNTIINIDKRYIYPIIFVCLVVVILYTLFDKSSGNENMFTELNKKNVFYGMIMALVIGFYNGFLGPGTGSFLVFAIIKIFKYDFVNANGNSKILNFVGNLTSLVIFILNGKVMYLYGIPIALVMVVAAQIGANFAIKKGSKFIKRVFLVVTLLTAISLLKTVL